MSVLQRSILESLSCHRGRELRVFDYVILAVLFTNYADLLLRVALGTTFKRRLQIFVVCEADLNRVKNFVESVVNSDNLHVFKSCDQTLDLSIALQAVKKGTVAIRSKFQRAG